MDLSVQSCVCVCGGVRACMHVRFCIFSSLSVLTTVHYRGYQSFNLLREVSTAKKKIAAVATYELRAEHLMLFSCA